MNFALCFPEFSFVSLSLVSACLSLWIFFDVDSSLGADFLAFDWAICFSLKFSKLKSCSTEKFNSEIPSIDWPAPQAGRPLCKLSIILFWSGLADALLLEIDLPTF